VDTDTFTGCADPPVFTTGTGSDIQTDRIDGQKGILDGSR